jgi:hypothetical protein
MISSKVNVYQNVRCGLAYAYMIEGNATIVIEDGTCGILYDETSNSYTFLCQTLPRRILKVQ